MADVETVRREWRYSDVLVENASRHTDRGTVKLSFHIKGPS